MYLSHQRIEITISVKWTSIQMLFKVNVFIDGAMLVHVQYLLGDEVNYGFVQVQ